MWKSAAVVSVVLAVAFVGVGAHAEDTPSGARTPTPLPPIASPFLESLVGSWDAMVKAQGTELKGTDRWTKILDGTAYLHELHFGPFDGMGVVRVADDGKTATMWWYDSMGQGAVWTFHGTVDAEGLELASEEGGMKATKGIRKSGDGLTYRMTVFGKEMVLGSWTRAATPAPAAVPADGALAKHPLIAAQLGEWTVKGKSVDGAEHSGTSRFRLAVGGHNLVQDYEIRVPVATLGFGVTSLGADGTSTKTWTFGNYFAREPMVVTGKATANEWKGAGKHPAMGDMEAVFTKQDSAFEAVYSASGKELFRETFTRK